MNSPQAGELPALSDNEIDEAAHELQRVIVECGGDSTECAYDYLRGILAKLPVATPMARTVPHDAAKRLWGTIKILGLGNDRLALQAIAAALAGLPGQPKQPDSVDLSISVSPPAAALGHTEGFEPVSVKGFWPLMEALDRADRKGYMPDAMAEEWAAFRVQVAGPGSNPARELMKRLREGDWNLRAPQEMADMAADFIECALATQAPAMDEAEQIEFLARASGLKGPADAWTILRSAIASSILRTKP